MLLTLVEVLGMIAVLLALVTVLGMPLASVLPPSVALRARWALAPALGLAAATCLLTSLNWWMPARDAVWAGLLPAGLLALAMAWRRRKVLWCAGASRSLLVPVALALVVATAFSAPLAYQQAFGPGGFQVWDGPNYASSQHGLMYHAVSDRDWGPEWSLSVYNGEYYMAHNPLHQQVGFDAVAAATDAATGLTPVQTQVPFMIALVVIGALSAYGAFLVLFASGWGALLAGALYAGPVMLQLVLDGSEGAIAGIMHLFPLVVLGVVALRPRPGPAPAALFAIVAASAAAAYPVFFPAVGLASVAVWLIALGQRIVWWGQPARRTITRFVGVGALVAAGTAAAAPFAFGRSIEYWRLLIKGHGQVGGLPAFDLPLPVLPGYVLGTREFYFLPHVSDTNAVQWLLTDVLALGLLALIAFAVVRWRRLWPLVVLTLAMMGVAVGVSGSGCGYCVQRSVLPLGPLAGFFLAAAAVGLSVATFRASRLTAAAVAVVTLGLVWHTTATLVRRGALGAYFMPTSVSSTLAEVGRQPGPVLLEGFGANADAPGEFPSALLAAGGGYAPGAQRLSVLVETNDFQGMAYLGPPRPAGPEFAPGYRTVATRLVSVRTARQRVSSHAGIAMDRRVQPFDATAESGIFVNRARKPDRRVFVIGPMSFGISGPPGREVALQVGIGDLTRAQLGKLPRGSIVRRRGRDLTVCVPVIGQRATLRRVVVPVAAGLTGLVNEGWYANHPTARSGPTLKSVYVLSRCGAAS